MSIPSSSSSAVRGNLDPADRPNVVIVLADDMGFSDIGCYGGEIATPNLDRLAANGIRMAQFYNTARCSPSRASLLTGLHPHQTGVGVLTDDQRPLGYAGELNDRCVTVAEVLAASGYATCMSGKWHLTGARRSANHAWPTRRGFHHFWGTISGAGDYWNPATLHRGEVPVAESELPAEFFYTDAISDTAVDFVRGHDSSRPFFLYVAYTAPHWPLHADENDIARYRGRFDAGWDVLRERRLKRLVAEGILDKSWLLSDRDPDIPAWDAAPDHAWEARRMEVYTAQVEVMDRGIGRIVDALVETGKLENTLLIFLSDNGGCAEELSPGYVDELDPAPAGRPTRTRDGNRVFHGNSPDVTPGPESTFASYGKAWANLSNTPFREYKHWVHEGGIATPMIVHWPAGLDGAGVIRQDPHQLTDVMATVVDVTGTSYPTTFHGRNVLPLEGVSMLGTWRGEANADRTLYWEHEGNAAVRRGNWKLVRKFHGAWELYDLATDRTELHDAASSMSSLVAELAELYEEWAQRCGVLPRDQVLAAAE